AAAHSKVGNNEQALRDCFRAIEIDPSFSKVYGRLGAIYLTTDKVNEALDAYKKAHALDPNNENYKQSIRLCEERLNATNTNPPNAPNLTSMFGSLLGGASDGPDMMSFLNNPALVNMGLMANLVTNLGGQEGGQVGQRMASELSSNNPNLIDSLRRNMTNASQPNRNNNSAPNSDNQSDLNRPSSS
ncbi:unnamed protein product, partial [Rotaria magnacalcarata]